jgi:L-aspartate oxidase
VGSPARRQAARQGSETDVLVIGAGAAGASAALAAAAGGRRVTVVVKAALDDGATRLAQGGLAAVLGADDSRAAHAADTLAAGAGLGDAASVSRLVATAPRTIERLRELGACFDTTPDTGALALGREGGHSRRRIVHAGGDASGAEVARVLGNALRASPVRIVEHTVVRELLLDENGRVTGALLARVHADGRLGADEVMAARAVVLATGGAGRVYAVTSNPAQATGDGLALAARAGADLTDLEFVQFHPTLLAAGARHAAQRALITEALRGDGAVLVDADGARVMAGAHPLADLAPRDVVAATMHARMQGTDPPLEHLWLDATRLGDALPRRFPTVYAACRAAGVDPTRQPIPVAPGAHYCCGGVRADLAGNTGVPGLFAVGEVAGTGVHGANRLASNSLTEALIAGTGAGRRLAAKLPEGLPGRIRPALPIRSVDPAHIGRLTRAMSRHAGVSRTGAGLAGLLDQLITMGGQPRAASTLAELEAANLHLVATMIATAALERAESRGCHRRSDTQRTERRWAAHLLLRLDGTGQPVVRSTRAGWAA